MGQKKTHKYAKELYILKKTIKQLENGDIEPTVPKLDEEGRVFVKLYSTNLIEKDYAIEIKEL